MQRISGRGGGKKTRSQGKQCVLFESLPNIAVIMACRDYYAIARRWNIKWTAIDRLNIRSLRNVVFIARIMPFFARFLLFLDFFSRARARERERKERREIDGTSRLERIFHERNLWESIREKRTWLNKESYQSRMSHRLRMQPTIRDFARGEPCFLDDISLSEE